MLSEDKLAEIKQLEAEQAEIKAKIAALKENSNLCFSTMIDGESSKNAIRKLVVVMAQARYTKRYDNSVYISTHCCKATKASEMSQEQMKNMNAFISEIAPIVNKYIELNASLFEVGRK